MGFIKNHFFLIIRALSVLIFCCLYSSGRAEIRGNGDSLVSSKNPDSHFVYQNKSIQALNEEELISLVEYLFNMDTVNPALVTEINSAIANLKNNSSRLKISENIEDYTFPSAGLYESWEIDNLFPEKDLLKLEGDTSVTLELKWGGHDKYVNPFNGNITSGFGWRDSAQHNGVDIDLNRGDVVSAAFDGMVRIAKRQGGFGNIVIVRHYNGLETVYAHLSKIKVKPGQVIMAGQTIGLGGNTGHTTGTHLHFEVRFKGVPINPKYLISFQEQKLVCNELVIKKTKWGLAAFPKDIKFYTIEKGDTIFEIAKRFGKSTSSIKEMNGITGRVHLKAGQQINVVQ